MESLWAGLAGALIATLLSILYFYISEQSRFRSETTLEVISYFDDIYTRLQILHAEKKSACTGKERELSDEEYRMNNKILRDLLNTSRVRTKLAIVYGEGKVISAFNYLKDSCSEVAEILWDATAQNWSANTNKIFTLFNARIDPAIKSLESSLIEKTRARRIIKNFVKRYLHAISKKGK